MTNEIPSFNFRKYDVGGEGATSGDGKLTGAEVAKAQEENWCIWDGFQENDTAKQAKQYDEANDSLAQFGIKGEKAKKWHKFFDTLCNMVTSGNYQKVREQFNARVNELVDQYLQDDSMSYQEVVDKAYKQAQQELGLNDKSYMGAFNVREIQYLGSVEK